MIKKLLRRFWLYLYTDKLMKHILIIIAMLFNGFVMGSAVVTILVFLNVESLWITIPAFVVMIAVATKILMWGLSGYF